MVIGIDSHKETLAACAVDGVVRRAAAGGGKELAGGATLPQAPSVECDLPRAYGRSPLTQAFHWGLAPRNPAALVFPPRTVGGR
jgi:hypothetical protein